MSILAQWGAEVSPLDCSPGIHVRKCELRVTFSVVMGKVFSVKNINYSVNKSLSLV